MEAGRELDALVAEKVMRWKVNQVFDSSWEDEQGNIRTWEDSSFKSFRPSTDIAAAWEVVEKIQGFDFMVKVWSPNQDTHEEGTYQGLKRGEWECTMWKWFDRVTGRIVPPFDDAPDPRGEHIRRTHAETAPHAICLTALKIIGIDAE